MDYEITDAQISYIVSLMAQRRVSAQTASRIIEMLMKEPPINDQGMDVLKKIVNPD